MECYSAIKKEILLFVATWMEHEDITLIAINQRKVNIIQSHLHVESKKKTKFVDTENRSVVARSMGGLKRMVKGVRSTNI